MIIVLTRAQLVEFLEEKCRVEAPMPESVKILVETAYLTGMLDAIGSVKRNSEELDRRVTKAFCDVASDEYDRIEQLERSKRGWKDQGLHE